MEKEIPICVEEDLKGGIEGRSNPAQVELQEAKQRVLNLREQNKQLQKIMTESASKENHLVSQNDYSTSLFMTVVQCSIIHVLVTFTKEFDNREVLCEVLLISITV